MAEINNAEITQNFEKITELINSMRAQGVLSASGTDKILSAINTKLDSIMNDENQELVKTFLAELKRNLDEKYGFIAARFTEMETIYNNLSKEKEGAVKSEEIKEFFDIIATNLNVFSKEVISQKDILTEITLRIESMRADDSDKKEVLKNISALKVDLEHFNNGFESIVLNLNNNFKNITDGIEKIITLENSDQYAKDIENLYLTSNAILSAIQIIDQKSDTLNSDLTGLLKESDFKALITQLNAQNEELNYLMSSLAKRDEVLDLFQKVDAAIGVITALKTVLVENGEKSHGEILVTLSKLEDTVRKILSEEEFDKFRAELSKLVSEVSHSTNLMRGDLLETNAELRNLTSLLSSLDIKTNIAGLTTLINKNDEKLTATLDEMSQKIIQSSEFNALRAVGKTDEVYNNLTDRLNDFDEKNNVVLEEVKESVKSELVALQGYVNDLSENLQGKSQELATSIIEQAQKFEQKISEVDFSISDFSRKNIENLEEQIYELKNAIKTANDGANDELNQKIEKAIALTESLSASLVVAFDESDSSTKHLIEESFNRTNETLDQNSKTLGELSETASTLGTALSFAEATIKQKIEEELGAARDMVEKTTNDISGSVGSFTDSVEGMKQNLDNLRQDIHLSVDNMREVVSSLPQTLTQNYEQLSRENKDLLEQNLHTLIEDLQGISGVVSVIDASVKQKIEEEFNAAKEILRNTSESSSSSISNLSLEVINKLNVLEETAITAFRESDGLTVGLKDALSENMEKIKLLIQEVNDKADTSSNKVADLKNNLELVSNEISLLLDKLDNDEEKQAIISNFDGISQKLDLISENVGPKDRNKADFDYIERNLESIITILNEYDKKLENEEIKELITAEAQKIDDINQQVKLVEESLQEAVNSRVNALISELGITKNAIDDIVFTSLPEGINNLKAEAEISLNELKNHISENSKTLSDTYQSMLFERFDNLLQRISLLEEEQNDKRAQGLTELKGLLANMSSLLSDIISYVSVDNGNNSGSYSEDFTKIENILTENNFAMLDNFKYSIDETVTKINEKLQTYQENTKNYVNSLKTCIEDNTSIIREEVKNYSLGISEIYEKFDALDDSMNNSIIGIKNSFLPVIESNQELSNSINSNLLLINEKMQERASKIEELLSSGDLKQIPEIKTDLYDLFTELKQLNTLTKDDLIDEFYKIADKTGTLLANAENNKDAIISSLSEQITGLQNNVNTVNDKLSEIVNTLNEKSDIRFNTLRENFVTLNQKIEELSEDLQTVNKANFETFIQKINAFEEKLSGMDSLIDDDMTKQLTLIQEEFMSFSKRLYAFSEQVSEYDAERAQRINDVFDSIVNNIDTIKQKSEMNVALITEKTEELVNNAANRISNELSERNEYNLQNYKELTESVVGSITNAVLEAFSRNAEINISRIKANTEDVINDKTDDIMNIVRNVHQENYDKVSQLAQNFVNDIIQNLSDNFYQKSEINKGLIVSKIDESVHSMIEKTLEIVNNNTRENLQNINELLRDSVLDIKTGVEAIEGSLINAENRISERITDDLSNHSDLIVNEVIKNQDTALNISNRIEKIRDDLNSSSETILNESLKTQNAISGVTERISEDLNQNSNTVVEELNKTKNIISEDVSYELQKTKDEISNIVVNEIQNTQGAISDINYQISEKLSQNSDAIVSELQKNQNVISEIAGRISENLGQNSESLVNELQNTQSAISGITDRISEDLSRNSETIFNESLKTQNAISGITNTINENLSQNTNVVVNEIQKTQGEISEITDKVSEILNRNSENIVNEVFKTQDAVSNIPEKVSDTIKEGTTILLGEISSNAEENSSLLIQKLETILKEEVVNLLDCISTKNSDNLFQTRVLMKTLMTESSEDLSAIIDQKNQQIVDILTGIVDSSTKSSEQVILSNLSQQGNQNINLISEKINDLVNQNRDTLETGFNGLNQTIGQQAEDVKNKFGELSNEVNQLIIQNAQNLRNEFGLLNQKVDPDRMLSEISSYLNNKLDENTQDLKAFIDMKSSGDVDITIQIDNLKSDIVDMFNDYGKVFKDIVSQINAEVENSGNNEFNEDINEKIDNLPDRIDNKIDSLLSEYQSRLSDIVRKGVDYSGGTDNSNIEEIINSNSSRLMSSFEAMKNDLNDEIFAKFEEFNINIQRQMQIMQKLEELSEFSKTASDSSSDLSVLYSIKEALENNDRNLNSVKDALDNIYRNSLSRDEVKSDLSEISAKLEDLNVDIRVQGQRIQDMDNVPTIGEIEDLFNMNVNSLLNDFEKKLSTSENGDLKGLVEEIKSEINSQLLGLLGKISFVSEQEEIIDFVQDKSNELKSLIKKLDNSLDARFEDGYKGYADDLRELVKDFKENSNFKDTLNDIKKQLETIKSSDEKSDYTYSLQDIETDIAKLRMTLNQMSESSNYNDELDEITKSINELASTVDFIKAELPHNEVFEIKNEIERISEDLVSISTRTNKLILSSNESNNELRDNLSDFRLVIRDLDERTRDLANTTNMEKMNARVEKIGKMVNSCINSDKILNQAFSYLAEWIDGAGENLNFISENMNKFENLEASVDNLSENIKYIAENNNSSQNMDELKNIIYELKNSDENKDSMLDLLEQKFENQQNRIDELEMKLDKLLGILDNNDNEQLNKKIGSIDKQLSKLNKSIERLTSYVDEE
ncbi:hypothetical protein IJI31_07660 [bacterium]|nr:hypothetical protein [bacterium]